MVDSEDIHVREQDVSRAQKARETVSAWQIPISLIIISTAILIGTGRWSIPELPEWMAEALKVVILGIIPATLVGKILIVDKFMPDPRPKVLHVDPLSGFFLDWWRVPEGVWEQRERGEYPALDVPAGFFDYVVTEFQWDDDDETLRVEGCNPEIADPVSIMARDGALKEVYRSLQHDRAELLQLRATVESRALDIDQQNVNDLMEAVEHGARFGGSAWSTIQRDEWSEDLQPDADERERADTEEPEQQDGPTLNDLLAAAHGSDGATTNGTQGAVSDD